MAITSAVGDFVHSIYELFASFFGAIYNVISGIIVMILSFFRGIVDLFADVFGGVFEVLGGVGKFVLGMYPIFLLAAWHPSFLFPSGLPSLMHLSLIHI